MNILFNKYTLLLMLLFSSLLAIGAEVTPEFVDSIQTILGPSGSEVTVEVESPEYNDWLKSQKFLEEFQPVKFLLKMRPDKHSSVETRSGKRFPLEAEKRMGELLLNLEEILFLKLKIQSAMADKTIGKIYLKNEKLILEKNEQSIEIEFDDDLRSLGKKFVKKIIITKGTVDRTEINIDSKLTEGVMMPREIKLTRQSTRPIFASNGKFFHHYDVTSFLLSDYDISQGE